MIGLAVMIFYYSVGPKTPEEKKFGSKKIIKID